MKEMLITQAFGSLTGKTLDHAMSKSLRSDKANRYPKTLVYELEMTLKVRTLDSESGDLNINDLTVRGGFLLKRGRVRKGIANGGGYFEIVSAPPGFVAGGERIDFPVRATFMPNGCVELRYKGFRGGAHYWGTITARYKPGSPYSLKGHLQAFGLLSQEIIECPLTLHHGAQWR